jgi:hypothetical protein
MDFFLELYGRNFDITGGQPMEAFIGLESVQSNASIRINLDYYIEHNRGAPNGISES